ncbi:MAG: DUF4250 domain-containing protein [Epulopiscium sp.]|nr:DUF4250 domain-containing protein [Candidatus Epulonipiscium sp.]
MDPYITLSWVNTKLRNQFDTLEMLCEDMGLSQKEIENRLEQVGYSYDPLHNQFIGE